MKNVDGILKTFGKTIKQLNERAMFCAHEATIIDTNIIKLQSDLIELDAEAMRAATVAHKLEAVIN